MQYKWLCNTLQWRHNEHDRVSIHRHLHCLLNCWFRRRSKKTSMLRVTGLCAANSPVTGEFPAQRVSYAKNVSIWWRHHECVFPAAIMRTNCYCEKQIWRNPTRTNHIQSTWTAHFISSPKILVIPIVIHQYPCIGAKFNQYSISWTVILLQKSAAVWCAVTCYNNRIGKHIYIYIYIKFALNFNIS